MSTKKIQILLDFCFPGFIVCYKDITKYRKNEPRSKSDHEKDSGDHVAGWIDPVLCRRTGAGPDKSRPGFAE